MFPSDTHIHIIYTYTGRQVYTWFYNYRHKDNTLAHPSPAFPLTEWERKGELLRTGRMKRAKCEREGEDERGLRGTTQCRNHHHFPPAAAPSGQAGILAPIDSRNNELPCLTAAIVGEQREGGVEERMRRRCTRCDREREPKGIFHL